MATIIDLTLGQYGDDAMADINTNFDTLNTDKLETSAYTDATTSAAGKTRLSTAPVSVSIPIAVGDNDPRVPTVAQVGYIPSTTEKDALVGTSGTPSTSNKYVTNDDTATAATANKVARRLAGGNITVVTETSSDNSTNAASTAFVKTIMPIPNNQKFQAYAISAIPASFSVAHGLAAAPSFVKVKTYCDRAWGSGYGAIVQIGEGNYKAGSYSTWYITTASANPPAFAAIATTTATISQLDYANSGSSDDATFTMTISSIDATNINFAITRTIGGSATGNILFAVEFLA